MPKYRTFKLSHVISVCNLIAFSLIILVDDQTSSCGKWIQYLKTVIAIFILLNV